MTLAAEARHWAVVVEIVSSERISQKDLKEALRMVVRGGPLKVARAILQHIEYDRTFLLTLADLATGFGLNGLAQLLVDKIKGVPAWPNH